MISETSVYICMCRGDGVGRMDYGGGNEANIQKSKQYFLLEQSE